MSAPALTESMRFRLEAELKAALEAHAVKVDRPPSSIIRAAVREYLAARVKAS